jgi:two-component system chemotaxis response regulator CheY
MNLLIVEDQAPAALFLRQNLERLGYRVTLAENGEDAWNILLDQPIPIVISDWMMPRVDGIELCRRIRRISISNYTYLFLLTSRDRHEDRVLALRAGADDFLLKPPNIDELALRLEVAKRILRVHDELARMNAQLRHLATTDELTGVKNRRRFLEDLHWQFSLTKRKGVSLSLILLDVDHFKQYNDAYGHLAGDHILRLLAAILRDQIRPHDIIARYGGEEFIVLLPDTDADDAASIAERLRAAVHHHHWPRSSVTISCGVASYHPRIHNPEQLIDQADRALYHSKNLGRNRVTHFTRLLPAAVGS